MNTGTSSSLIAMSDFEGHDKGNRTDSLPRPILERGMRRSIRPTIRSESPHSTGFEVLMSHAGRSRSHEHRSRNSPPIWRRLSQDFTESASLNM